MVELKWNEKSKGEIKKRLAFRERFSHSVDVSRCRSENCSVFQKSLSRNVFNLDN